MTDFTVNNTSTSWEVDNKLINSTSLTRKEELTLDIKSYCMELAAMEERWDEVARDIVKEECKLKDAKGLQNLDCVTRNGYLRMLKDKYSLSIRQIERITGINRGIVLKA